MAANDDITERAYQLLDRVEAQFAGATLDDIGIVLALLAGKWLTLIPEHFRHRAVRDFIHNLKMGIRFYEDEDEPAPKKEVRH